MSTLRCAILIALISFCMAAGAHAASRFVDARDYPSPGAGAAAFSQMEAKLIEGFYSVCGDTFCESDYNNYLPLHLSCSVRVDNGVLRGCQWALAGSQEVVDPVRGAILSEVHAPVCSLPLAGGTLLSALLASVEGGDNLHKPLPGTKRSVYDALVDCLSGRIDQ